MRRDTGTGARWLVMRELLSYCAKPVRLRRTVTIALVVGVILTAVNQLQIILGGHATAATWVRCGVNFLVPFVVSNLGLLTGRERPAPGGRSD